MFWKCLRCIPDNAMCCDTCRKANANGNNVNIRYHTSGGFFAYIPQLDRYILFPTEMEYWEYMSEFEITSETEM